ncbi:MAG: NERD domain-containing protein, partial [Bacteroidetes bacterium]
MVGHRVPVEVVDDEAGRGDALQGEADFVILHPDYGMLVIEVKGGGVTWDRAKNRWFSEGRHARNPIADPFRQAQRCVRAFQ